MRMKAKAKAIEASERKNEVLDLITHWVATWIEPNMDAPHEGALNHQGRIYFTKAMYLQALDENKRLQEIKKHENKGRGEQTDAWIGMLGEICCEWLVNCWGLSHVWERLEPVKTITTDPDFINTKDGMTLEIKTTRNGNSLYIPNANHFKEGKKDKSFDVYIGFVTSWTQKGHRERLNLHNMFADDYTGPQPYLEVVGFNTKRFIRNMIKNRTRKDIGDAPQPVNVNREGEVFALLKGREKYMEISWAKNRWNPYRMVLPCAALFQIGALEKFLTQKIHLDKWDRGIHLLALNP